MLWWAIPSTISFFSVFFLLKITKVVKLVYTNIGNQSWEQHLIPNICVVSINVLRFRKIDGYFNILKKKLEIHLYRCTFIDSNINSRYQDVKHCQVIRNIILYFMVALSMVACWWFLHTTIMLFFCLTFVKSLPNTKRMFFLHFFLAHD